MAYKRQTGGKLKRSSKVGFEADGENVFVTVDGLKIAKRGQPNTPYAKTWVSLEPGWSVVDVGYPPEAVDVSYEGVKVH
jgi:hypothetical protein